MDDQSSDRESDGLLRAHDLVGIWITDNFMGHSEEVIVLMPDGTGAIDYYNPTFAGREEFQWEVIDSGAKMRFTPAIWRDDTRDISTYFDSRNRRVLEFGNNYRVYLTNQKTTDYVAPKE
jgi:hypothetical protein